MKQNIPLKHLALWLAVASGFAAVATAQTNPPVPEQPASSRWTFGQPSDAPYGLLGHKSSALDFTYIRHKDGPPKILRSYGVVLNAPAAPGLDTGLKYHFMSGKDTGLRYRQHEAMGALTAYAPLGWARPFLEGNAGWVWNRTNRVHDDDFAYRATAGLELGARVPFALTPYVTYEDTPNYREKIWSYGAKATVHFMTGWSATMGANIDENSTTEYRLAFNLHL